MKAMKGLFIGLGVMMAASVAGASVLSELKSDVVRNTRFTLLTSITPAYFYDFSEGTQRASKAGVVTSVFEYRFLSGDIGWAGSFDTKARGTLLGGGSLHVDKMLRQFFPDQADYIKYVLVPNSAQAFWDKVNFGMYAGHNFDRSAFEYGVYSGINLRF